MCPIIAYCVNEFQTVFCILLFLFIPQIAPNQNDQILDQIKIPAKYK